MYSALLHFCMATRITFLGTAGENCVIYKYDKSAGGILIEHEGQFFLLDPGPGALVQAGKVRFNFRENTAIILSSPRLEQCNDVNAVIDAMTASGLDKRGVLLGDMKSFNGESILIEKYKSWLERIIHLEPGKRVGIEDLDMEALPTKNNDSIGVSFLTKDGKITYTSNTTYTKEICESYMGSDVMIINVFNPRGVSTPGFLNTADAIDIIQTVKPKLALITHFGLKMIKAEPLYEAREIQKFTNIQIIAAKEGLSVSLTPYSSSVIVK